MIIEEHVILVILQPFCSRSEMPLTRAEYSRVRTTLPVWGASLRAVVLCFRGHQKRLNRRYRSATLSAEGPAAYMHVIMDVSINLSLKC
ncbi:hypothetical protein GQ457_02G009720 [Hibiscus cannabinus]